MTTAYAKADDRWTLSGLDTVILANDQLRVTVIPGLGGHVQQIEHRPSGLDVLFENPRRGPHPPVYGEPWSGWLGGIDEMIPTGWGCRHQGETYPDHGEVLTQPWTADVIERGPDRATLRMSCHCILAPLRVERTLALAPGSPVLRMQHRVTNLSERPVDFLWGLHTTFDGRGDYRIDIPVTTVYEEHYRQAFFDGGPIPEYRWPHRESADMRRPQPGPDMVLHYALAREGWLAFTDLDRNIGLAVGFDESVFKALGMWILRGRGGHKAAAVVPWTGYPVRLSDAATEQGVCATLAGGQSIETSTTWIVYRDLASVGGIRGDEVLAGDDG
jgi:galactose mutarotase-like enzyme